MFMDQLSAQVSVGWLAGISVLFIVKHLLADFLLQTRSMAVGKDAPAGWFRPLATHAAVHAALTAAICLLLSPALVWLAAVDFLVHAAIDRAKALIGQRWRLTPGKSAFWWLLGIDQTLHHLTHLAFVVVIAASL